MSKKTNITKPTRAEKGSAPQDALADEIMQQVRSGAVEMKPRWYFVAGTLLAGLSLAGLTITSMFFAHLTLFTLRSHGPMGQWRMEQMIASFPWWIPLLAILGMAFSIYLLRRYDFSYKHNFGVIVLILVVAVFAAVWIIDSSGIANSWTRREPMRRFYHQRMLEEGIYPQPIRPSGRMMQYQRNIDL